MSGYLVGRSSTGRDDTAATNREMLKVSVSSALASKLMTLEARL